MLSNIRTILPFLQVSQFHPISYEFMFSWAPIVSVAKINKGAFEECAVIYILYYII